MKHKINNTIKIFATGFIVLVFLNLILFLVRSSFESDLSTRKPEDLIVRREPSGLVPDEFENDPNVKIHSVAHVQAHINDPLSFGIVDYLEKRVPGGRHSYVYFYNSEDDYMYFDKKSGLIVHQYEDLQLMPDKRSLPKPVRIYIGPEGVSETQDKTLGRFIEPIIDRGWIYRPQRNSRELIVYDKKMRRFFKIDFVKASVNRGPELVNNILHYEPIQIGRLNKSRWLNLGWEPPIVKENDESPDIPSYMRGSLAKPIIPTEQGRQAGPYLLVLDESGRIDLLDRESLEFVQNFNSGAGRLFDPESYIRSRRISARPEYLLGYDVLPLFLTTHFYEGNMESKKVFFGEPSIPADPAPSRIEKKYLGMLVASLSRSGTGLALSAYNEKGIGIIKREAVVQKEGPRAVSHRSSRVVYFRPSWTAASTVCKYLAEAVHPPILSLGSFYTAYSIDADSGHKALFLLPNSFIAMQGRIDYGNFMVKLLAALWFMLPSIIFSIWLAVRVSKNAIVVGLSENARLSWILGTLAFGLVAYLTYRLTRPKITLVTCPNCGKMRRPDMDRCHRCKSAWFVPELTPPAWRVLDGTGHAKRFEQIEQAEQPEQSERPDEGLISDAEGAEEAATE